MYGITHHQQECTQRNKLDMEILYIENGLNFRIFFSIFDVGLGVVYVVYFDSTGSAIAVDVDVDVKKFTKSTVEHSDSGSTYIYNALVYIGQTVV